MPLLLTWRGNKRGTTEDMRFAHREFCALLDRWRADDKVAARNPDLIVAIKREAGWRACDL